MILGVDLGEKTTGLATSDSLLATPLTTITHRNIDEAAQKVAKLTKEIEAEKIVVGFVEGKIKTMFYDFAQKLRELVLDVEVVMIDETLTTGQAQQTLIKLAVKRDRRQAKEHEVAAALILQSYLDETSK